MALVGAHCTAPTMAAQGRYSFIGAQPSLEIVATQGRVVILDHEAGTRVEREVRLTTYPVYFGLLCTVGDDRVDPSMHPVLTGMC